VELTVRHLEALCAIEEEGSIGRAAARLGISQPALTAQLHRIEREVGQQVFDRSHLGVTVTRPGRRMLTHAHMALTSIARLREEAESLCSGRTVVRLGGHGPLLMALINHLGGSAAHDASITARAEKSSQLLELELEHDKLDYALLRELPGREIPLGEGIEEWELVDREPLFIGLASSHRLAVSPVVDLADLRDEAWVLDPDDDTGENDLLRFACERAGFEPRPGLITGDNGVARSYIGSGRAVALFEARAQQDHELVVRPLRGDPIWCRLVLRWRSGAALAIGPDEMTRALAAIYDEVVARHPVYRQWPERTARSAL
jgi:DNA-binding transcriptional LysR family regulator